MTLPSRGSLVTAEMVEAKGVWSAPRVSWPVSRSDIRKWAQAVYWPEVPPRIYWDEEYARTTRWEGTVAPQDFNPFAWPLEGAWGQDRAQAELSGASGTTPEDPVPALKRMNGGMTNRYSAPMRPGDVITARSALISWDERETRLGPTLFVTHETHWTNQRLERVVVRSKVTIHY